MTESEGERRIVDRGKGGRAETVRMLYKDRCVTMYGGRVAEKGAMVEKRKVWLIKVRMETKEWDGKRENK